MGSSIAKGVGLRITGNGKETPHSVRCPTPRPIRGFLCTVILLAVTNGSLARSNWPAVLVIDDFEAGLERWENQDSGRLSLTDDAAQGNSALLWTAKDDGIGHIVFRHLNRNDLDFSQYDLLTVWIKVDGKPIGNLSPIIQQYPAIYGFRGLFYSIDTMHPFGKWFRLSQDLTRWENAWPNTFSRTNQEFQFEIHQRAGAAPTRISLDHITLLKNPIGLPPSSPGAWGQLDNGDQVTDFQIKLTNRGEELLHVTLAVVDQRANSRFRIDVPTHPIALAPGATVTVPVRAQVEARAARHLSPYYGEPIRVAATVKEIPALLLYTDLMAATRPAKIEHPCIACSVDRMHELQAAYADEKTRPTLDSGILNMVKAGEKALGYKPEYPDLAATGRIHDPVSGGKLVEIDVPNLPFRVYQDPESGRTYSGPLYDAGMQGHLQKHMNNAANAQRLGLAYLVTGRKEFAEGAARILQRYTEVYLALPITAPEQASPVGSRTSGSVRIGSTYMRERVWLGNLALALDCIRPAAVLSPEQVLRIGTRVFQPAADNMMDHKVGLMNLQWMIQGAGLFAGLAAELPTVVARAMNDSHGIVRLTDMGFLQDGNWAENPSYQNVAKIAAYPALSAAIHNGLMPWNDRMQKILKASYKLYGPDTRSPTLGTGGWATPRLDDAGVAMFSAFITDPELAWVARNRTDVHGTYGAEVHARLRRTQPKVPARKTSSPIPTATTIASDYGGISMRLPGTDRYCYLHYGRELTHGHRNKLSLNAYAEGKWFMRNVMGGYGNNFANFLETSASANSIMVDGLNADADTGELLFHKSMDGVEIADAREIGAWKNVEHERTVLMTPDHLIVIDRCLGKDEHVFDWLFHPNNCGLSLERDTVRKPTIQSFWESILYTALPPTGRFAKGAPTIWRRKDNSGLVIAFLPVGQLYSTRVTDTFNPHDSLLWRQTGKTVRFAAVFRPEAQVSSTEVSVESVEVTDAKGKAADLDQGQAIRVVSPETVVTVLVNYSGRLLRAGPLRTRERVAVHVENVVPR